MVEESVAVWYPFPRQQTSRSMQVQVTSVEKEDNLLMEVNGVTDEEETGFVTKLIATEYVIEDRHMRL